MLKRPHLNKLVNITMPERTTTRQAETITGIMKGGTTTAITIITKMIGSITTKDFLTSIRTSPDTTKTGNMNLIINTISSNINMRKGKPEII